MTLFLSVSHYTALPSFSNARLLPIHLPPTTRRIKACMICNVGIAENAHYAIVVRSTDYYLWVWSTDYICSETRNTNKHTLVLDSSAS